MTNPKCENCSFYYPLEHNFVLSKTIKWQESHCCIMFPIVYKDGMVKEVGPNGKCEMFVKRDYI